MRTYALCITCAASAGTAEYQVCSRRTAEYQVYSVRVIGGPAVLPQGTQIT